MGRGRDPAATLAALALALVLGVTALLYGPALDGAFQFDDSASITRDWTIRDAGALLRDLRPADLLGPARPVTTLSFALDYARAGLDPRAFHVTSLVLHLAVVLLVWALASSALRGAGGKTRRWLPLLVAAAFALHPVQTESVAFAAQRAEVLAAGLGLATLLTLVRADRLWPQRRAWALAALATALHLLALGSKIVAVVTPAAFLLHRAVLPDDGAETLASRVRRAGLVSAPIWIVSVATAVKALVELGPGQTAGLHAGALGPWRHLLTELRVHWLYVRLVLWPVGQSVDHAFTGSPGLLHLPTLAALAATLAAAATALVLWRRAERGVAGSHARAIAFGILFFLVELSPSSSVVPIADLVAEHRAYLASAGVLLAAAAAADRLLDVVLRGRAPWARPALAVAVLAALGVGSVLRAEQWGNDVALWEDAATRNPSSARVWANVGYARHERGDLARALEAYERADRLATDPAVVGGIALNLSALCGEQGQRDRALAVLDRGLAAAPSDARLHTNRAAVLWQLRRLVEARAAAERALDLAGTGYPKAHDLLGLILADLGDAEGALSQFRAAMRLDPDTAAYAEHELLALARLGRERDACVAWARVQRSGAAGERARAVAASLGCR
jgi:tetratricopeptide (TPR) repeat protein